LQIVVLVTMATLSREELGIILIAENGSLLEMCRKKCLDFRIPSFENDLRQAVVCKILDGEGYDPESSPNFIAYARCVAKSVLIDKLKKERKQLALDTDGIDPACTSLSELDAVVNGLLEQTIGTWLMPAAEKMTRGYDLMSWIKSKLPDASQLPTDVLDPERVISLIRDRALRIVAPVISTRGNSPERRWQKACVVVDRMVLGLEIGEVAHRNGCTRSEVSSWVHDYEAEVDYGEIVRMICAAP